MDNATLRKTMKDSFRNWIILFNCDGRSKKDVIREARKESCASESIQSEVIAEIFGN